MVDNVTNNSILMWNDYDNSAVLKAQNHNPVCNGCELENICRIRLKLNLWLCCEIPDQHDYARLRNGVSVFNSKVLAYRLTATGFEKIPAEFQQRFA
jgi:hypothetical protein